MTTPEVLRAGAAKVRTGWVRGWRHQRDAAGLDQVCALGALEGPLGEYAEVVHQEAVKALARLLPQRPSSWQSAIMCAAHNVAHWNNSPDQTQENVAATMELAAILLEQEAAQVAETPARTLVCV